MKNIFCFVSFGLACLCSGLSLNGSTVSTSKRVSWSLPSGFWESVSLVAGSGGFSQIVAEGVDAPQGEPGAPALPTKTLLFAVPDGYVVDAVSVEASWKSLDANVSVYPVQEPTRGTEEPIFTPAKAEFYSMDVYPAAMYTQLPIATASGVDMVPVSVTPFRYLAKDKVLEVAESMSVTVSFKAVSGLAARSAASVSKPRYAAKLREQVQGMVENPGDVSVSSGLSARAAGGTQPDYIVISPSSLVNAWKTYIEARQAAHPDLIFAVKNADEIYSEYTNLYGVDPATPCRNNQEKIWSYIKDMGTKGTMYFVLGGPFLEDGATVYDGNNVLLTTANAIPGVYGDPCGEATPTDYFYACLDIKAGATNPYPWDADGNGTYCNGTETTSTIDMQADVVVARMSMTAFNYGTGAGVISSADLIAKYTEKLARGEALNYGGRFKNGIAGQSLNYQSYASGSNGNTVRRELDFYDEAYNMFDTRHRSTFIDSEVAQRNRARNCASQYRPVRGMAMMIDSAWSKGYASAGEVRTAFFQDEYEYAMPDSHGWALGTGGFDAGTMRCNTGLVKVFNAGTPCQTGWMDYTTGNPQQSAPCLGESAVNNPVGGALVSYNNSRSGWFSNPFGDDGLSSTLTTSLNESLFRDNKTTGLAWKESLSKRAAGMDGLSNRLTDCIIEIVHFGDPLVTITPLADMTWTGAANNNVWSTSAVNWHSSTNASVNVAYEHANNTYINASANQSITVSELISTLTMGVNQTTGNTLTLTGAGPLKVMNGLVVTNGNLALNVPGGVGREGVTFVGEAGILTLGSTSTTSTYIGKLVNASEVRMTGANAILDVSDNTAVGTTKISVTGTLGTVNTNNILRTRTQGTLASFPTIPVNNATLKLETVNVGGNAVSTTPLFAVTNGVLEIGTNPMWSWERLTRPIILNNSTLSATGKYVGFGNTASGVLDITSTGTSAISGASTITLMGETRINVTDTLTLSAKFTDAGSPAGSIRKVGAGTMVLSADTSAAGKLIVEEGTVTLTKIPLINVTNLTVKAGAKLILPHTAGNSYQVLVAGGTELVFEEGALIYDAEAPNTPLTGATSRSSLYFVVSGLRTWKGNASNGSGTWNTTASNKPWLDGATNACFAAGNAVQFPDLAGIANAAITVSGSLSVSFTDFSNASTAYTFTGSASDKVNFVTLSTMGPTTFNLPVDVASDLTVSKGVLQMATVDTPLIDVKAGATFGATCITNTHSLGPILAVRYIPKATVTANAGPATCELRLFRNGTAISWNGATITESEDGYTKNASHAVACLIDGTLNNVNKWWPVPSDAVLAAGRCYATITFATPIEMFDGYGVLTSDAAGGSYGRGPTAWELQVSYDGTTFYTVDSQSSVAASSDYDWLGVANASASVPGFTRLVNRALLPQVAVDDGGTLLAQGNHFAAINLQEGAILKGVTGQSLSLYSARDLSYPDGVGVIGVDASGMALTSTPVAILVGQNFEAYDLYRFKSLTPGAVLSIVNGNLCVAQSSGFEAPYTRSISANANWNTTDWSATQVSGDTTNSVSFTSPWSQLVLDTMGRVDLIVTNATSAVTMTVDTPVQVGAVAFHGGQDLTLTATGNNQIEAQLYDLRNFGADATLNFNTREADVYVSTNTTAISGGAGVLTFLTDGAVILNAQWTGRVAFGDGDNEIIYRGNQPGLPFNQKNVTIETAMNLRDFTWSGNVMTIASGVTVTAGTLRRAASNRNIVVDGGTLSVSSWVTDTDNVTPQTTIQNGGQLICSGSFKSSQFTETGYPTYTVTGPGSLLKVGNLTCNDWRSSTGSVFVLGNGGTLSMGADVDIWSGHSLHGFRVNVNNGRLAAHGNWTVNDARSVRFNVTVAGGSSMTLDPANYTIAYNRAIAETVINGRGGSLIVGSETANPTGKVVLSNASTYTGGTTITNATLEVTNVGALGIRGPVTMQQGATLNLGTYRPVNVLQANPKGKLKVTISDATASDKLIPVADNFAYPCTGFTVELFDSQGVSIPVDASNVKKGAGYLIYAPAGTVVLPYVLNVSSDTNWISGTWTDATGTSATPDWSLGQPEAMIWATGNGTVTLDGSVAVTNVLFRGAGNVTLATGTGGAFVDLAKIDASAATGSVTIDVAPGAATIVAGVDTAIKQQGTNTLSVASGMQVTLDSIAWDPSKISNSGTVRIKGGSAASPITITSGSNLGVYAIAENSFFKQAATGGNKVYKVTGAGAGTSSFIMESGQNWGMNAGTQIRDVTATLSTTYEFWIEPETAFDSSVDLVLSARTVHVGHGSNGWKNYTIGSLSGSGNIVNNVANPVISINMLRGPTTYSGACASALVVGGTYPLTLSGSSTGALTINPSATVILPSSGTTSGSIVNNGTLQLPADTARTFSHTISGSGCLVKTGSEQLTLDTANTHTGGVVVVSGDLRLNARGALGTGDLTLGAGTRLISGVDLSTTDSLATVRLAESVTTENKATIYVMMTDAMTETGLEHKIVTLANPEDFNKITFTIVDGSDTPRTDTSVIQNGSDVTVQLTNRPQTWTGLGDSDNWSDANNWMNQTAPTSARMDVVNFAGNTRLTPVNNIADVSVLTLNFLSSADAFTLGGTHSLAVNTIANQSSNTQTFALPINNGTVPLTTSGPLTFNGGITAGATTFNGITTLGGTTAFSGAVTMASSTTIKDGSTTGSAAVTIADGKTLTVQSGATAQFASLSQTSYWGATHTINGSLTIASAVTLNLSTLSQIQFNVGSTGVLRMNGVSCGTYAMPTFSGGGRINIGSGGLSAATASFANETTYSRSMAFNNVTMGAYADWSGLSQTCVSGQSLTGTVTFDTQDCDNSGVGHTITLSRPLTGSGNLVKTMAGTLVLNAANTYTGTTTINGGTLKLGAAATLGTGAVALSNATLAYNLGVYSPMFSVIAGATLEVTLASDQLTSQPVTLATVPVNTSTSAVTVVVKKSDGTIIPGGTVSVEETVLQWTPPLLPGEFGPVAEGLITYYDFDTASGSQVVTNYVWNATTSALEADDATHYFPMNANIGTPTTQKTNFGNAFSGGNTGAGLGTGSNHNGDWMFPTSTTGWTMSLWAMRNNATTRGLLLLNGLNTGLRTDSGADTEATLTTSQSGNIGYGFFMASDGKVVFRFATTADNGTTYIFKAIASTQTYSWGTAQENWHNISVVCRPGDTVDTVTLYVDGAAAGSTTIAPGAVFTPVSNRLSTRSESGDGGQAQQNALDDFAVWNRPLTELEVKTIATSGTPIKALGDIPRDPSETFATATGDALWTGLAWQPSFSIWSQDPAAIIAYLGATTASTVTVDTDVKLFALTLTNETPLTVSVATGKTLTATTIDASAPTDATTLNFNTGTANITAGADTILTQEGTGTLSIAQNMSATVPSWEASKVSGRGYLFLNAPTAETVITATPKNDAFTGTTVLTQGVWTFAQACNNGAPTVYPKTSNVIVQGENAKLDFTAGDVTGWNDAKSLSLSGGGSLLLSARDSFNGTITFDNGGRLLMASDDTNGGRALDLLNNLTWRVSGTTPSMVGGSAATPDAETGDPIVNSGKIAVRVAANLNVADGSQLDVFASWGGHNAGDDNNLSLATTKTGLGKLAFYRADSLMTGVVNVNVGTLALVNKGKVSSGEIKLASGAKLELIVTANTYTQTVANVISGAGRIEKLGPGTTILSGANTYSGGAEITAGTLKAMGTSALGTGVVTLTSGTLDITEYTGALPLISAATGSTVKSVGTVVPSFTAIAGATFETTLTVDQCLSPNAVTVATVPEGTAPDSMTVTVYSPEGTPVTATTSVNGAALQVSPVIPTRTITFTPTVGVSDLTWNTNATSFLEEGTSTATAFKNLDIVKFITGVASTITLNETLKPKDVAIGDGFTFTGTGALITSTISKTGTGASSVAPRVDAHALAVTGGSLAMTNVNATMTGVTNATFQADLFGKEQIKYVRLTITDVATSGNQPAIAEFRLFRGTERLTWPVGTTVSDNNVTGGGDPTRNTVTIAAGTAYPGAVGPSNEKQPGCLIDGYYGDNTIVTAYTEPTNNNRYYKLNKWWPTTNTSGPWAVQIEFPTAIAAFDGANFCTADHTPRNPKSWTLETSLDGQTWKTVNTTTDATFSAYQWNGGNENAPAFVNTVEALPTLAIASNATLVASGNYTAAVTLEAGATLKLTNTPLVIAPGSTLTAAGSVKVDVSDITLPAAGTPLTFLQMDTTVANAPNATDFVLLNNDPLYRVVKIDTGYQLECLAPTSPFTATVTTDSNWANLAWMGANGIAVPADFDWTTASLTNVTLNVTVAATVTVPTSVTIGALTITASEPVTISGSLVATSVNDSTSTAAVTLSFATGTANVTAGANTILMQAGSGTLTIAATKKATINVPWTGTISQTGTLVYAGTHTYAGAKILTDGRTTEIAGNFTQTSPVADLNDGTARGSRFAINQSGTLNITSGTINLDRFILNNTGTAGTITVNHTGGTVNMTAGTEPDNGSATTWPYTHSLGNPLFGHWQGHTDYNLSGTAVFNAANRYVGLNYQPGSATFNQQGGVFKVKAIVAQNRAQDPKAVYNLTGGTLELEERIDLPNSTTSINLGAGTVKATGAFTFVQQANLTDTATGTTIDVNGYHVALSSALLGAGKLVVTNSTPATGSLTLSAQNTYAGGTLLQAGPLTLAATSAPRDVTVYGNTALTVTGLNADTAAVALTSDASVTGSAKVTLQAKVTDADLIAGLPLKLATLQQPTDYSNLTVSVLDGTGAARNDCTVELQDTTVVVRLTVLPQTWTGRGDDNRWSTAANWLNTAVPSGALEVMNFAGTTRVTTTNDVTGLSVPTLSFLASAGAFTLAGTEPIAVMTVANQSSNTQTFALPIDNGTESFSTSGPLTFNGGVTAGVTTFNGVTSVSGINTKATTFNAAATIGGTNTLVSVKAYDTLTFASGTTTITGALTKNSYGSAQKLYTVSEGATVRVGSLVAGDQNGLFDTIAGTLTVDGSMTFDSNSAYSPYAGTHVTGTLTADKIIGTRFSGIHLRGNGVGRINIGTKVQGVTGAYTGAHLRFQGVTMGAYGNWSIDTTGVCELMETVKFNTLDSKDGITPRTITLGKTVSGSGNLVKEGAGTLVLNAANTYTGTTTITGGTLKLGVSGTFGTGDLALADGVTLDLSVATIAITNKVASVPLNARVTIEVGTRTFNEGDYLLRWTTIPEGVFVVKGTTDRRFVKEATGLKAGATLTVADVTTIPEKEAVLDAFRAVDDGTYPANITVEAKTQDQRVTKESEAAATVVNVLGITPVITPDPETTTTKAEIVYEFGIVSATLDGDGKLTLQIQVTATKGTLGSAVNGQLAVYPVVNGGTQGTAIAGTMLTNPTYGTNGIITMPAFDPGTNTIFTVKAVQP